MSGREIASKSRGGSVPDGTATAWSDPTIGFQPQPREYRRRIGAELTIAVVDSHRVSVESG